MMNTVAHEVYFTTHDAMDPFDVMTKVLADIDFTCPVQRFAGLSMVFRLTVANDAELGEINDALDAHPAVVSVEYSEPSTEFGILRDYKTGDDLRPASEDEWRASLDETKRDKGRGVIEVDGRDVFVDGGPTVDPDDDESEIEE